MGSRFRGNDILSLFVPGFAHLPQEIAYAAGGSEFAADIGREAQIALGIEPAGLGVGRQLAHDLGEGPENGLDLMRLKPPFFCHAHLSLTVSPD